MESHVWACMVLPLNGFGSINLILICSQFLLFAYGACVAGISGVVVIYSGIEKNSMDSLACYSAIVISFLLGFRILVNVKKNDLLS